MFSKKNDNKGVIMISVTIINKNKGVIIKSDNIECNN